MLTSYWFELRVRLLRCLIALVVAFAVGCYFANPLYHLLALPLLEQLPPTSPLIATQLTASLFIPFKLAFIVALLLIMPLLLHQLWRFVAPALYRQERRRIWPLLLLSNALFYLGVTFAYFVVFPLLFAFLIHTAPSSVTVMPDMSQFLDLCLQLFLAFGLAFETPVLTLLLVVSGVTTIQQLAAWRPYVIVGAFVAGMLLTPPDIISQILLAVPLWLLFEVGLGLARLFAAAPPAEKALH